MLFILSIASVGALISSTGELVLGSSSCFVSSIITQSSDYVKIKFISQLINGVSNVLQKLLRCFNGTKIQRLLYFHYKLFFL